MPNQLQDLVLSLTFHEPLTQISPDRTAIYRLKGTEFDKHI